MHHHDICFSNSGGVGGAGVLREDLHRTGYMEGSGGDQLLLQPPGSLGSGPENTVWGQEEARWREGRKSGRQGRDASQSVDGVVRV